MSSAMKVVGDHLRKSIRRFVVAPCVAGPSELFTYDALVRLDNC